MNNKQFNELSSAFYDKVAEKYAKQPKVDYEKLKYDLVQWIRNTVERTLPGATVIVGMSGGKDSTVVAKLLVEALGTERVYGIIMPNGEMSDFDDAMEACRVARIGASVINVGRAYDEVIKALGKDKIPDKVKTNLPSRLRMSVLYSIAASMFDGKTLVVNTSNFAEKLMGWGTLWGDTVGDFSPLGALMVNDVISLGYVLDIPPELLIKAPADGMTGKTDEEVLGFTYDEVEYVYDNLYNRDVVKTENYDKIRDRMYNMQWKQELIQLPTFTFVKNDYII